MKDRYNDNDLRPSIYFMDEKERKNGTKPIYFESEAINDKYKFAINKFTDDGKYVKGGKLCFTLNKVEIYADLNDIIFVDTNNRIVNITKASGVINTDNNKDVEHRQYILLLYLLDDSEDKYVWASMEGRTTAYNYIQDNIDVLNIDPDKSIVLTENVAYKDALSITEFVKYIQNGLVEEDDFNIDDYKVEE